MSHTPGPWVVDTVRQVAGCNGDIAVTRLYSGTIVAVAFARKPDETLANANLLAAAPDLLEACKAAKCFLEELENHGISNWSGMSKLEAAIAKAEGKVVER